MHLWTSAHHHLARALIAALLLAPLTVSAQPAPPKQMPQRSTVNLDAVNSGVAEVSTILVVMRGQIQADQKTIADLQARLDEQDAACHPATPAPAKP